jgi:DNA topoisomerase-2
MFPPPEPQLWEQTNFHSLSRNKCKVRMVRKEYGIVPALVKIFDEILVNASDNRLRHPKSCTRIDVLIDPGEQNVREPLIRVINDGKCIPVSMHQHERMYVPQMVFGVLLTGSNFDDSEKRITGGRHGYGAKLTNIFSKSFTIDIMDSKRKLRYTQSWNNNMRQVSEPIVQKIENITNSTTTDSVAVTFVPDLPRLTGDPNATCISEGEFGIMCRRVLDVAGCSAGKLHVTLNGVDVSLDSFDEYIQLYRNNHPYFDERSDTTAVQSSNPVLFKKLHSRLTLGVGVSKSGSFESVSFVNGISTHRGGTHVNVLVQQVVKKIAEKVAKMDAELGKILSSSFIRRYLFVCVDAHIENPAFDSQMKEFLTSSPDKFGCSYTLDKGFLDKLVKEQVKGGVGIIEEVIRFAKGRQQAGLLKEVGGGKQSKRQLLAIPKLEDAHQAGSESSSHLCTLILTEGDSAKALAVAGLEVVGRKHFGVFPLRGKFMNVRDAPVSKLAANKEVKALCAILGLEFEKQYITLQDRKKLRYGRVLLMTDQDTGK